MQQHFMTLPPSHEMEPSWSSSSPAVIIIAVCVHSFNDCGKQIIPSCLQQYSLMFWTEYKLQTFDIHNVTVNLHCPQQAYLCPLIFPTFPAGTESLKLSLFNIPGVRLNHRALWLTLMATLVWLISTGYKEGYLSPPSDWIWLSSSMGRLWVHKAVGSTPVHQISWVYINISLLRCFFYIEYISFTNQNALNWIRILNNIYMYIYMDKTGQDYLHTYSQCDSAASGH